MKIQSQITSQRGFTRFEVAIVLASVTLIAGTGVAVLGDSRQHSERVLCANNLRQIGRAFNMWASDHGGENPWWVSYTDGGGYIPPSGPGPSTIYVPGLGPASAALRNNAWFHFGFISEELRTAQVLVCPADRARMRAQDFSKDPTRGYFAGNFRDAATSYFIGAHAVGLWPSAMLSGDRSLKEDANNLACSANLGTVSLILMDGSPRRWSSDLHLHPAGGNLLANDGHVEELSPGGLNQFLGPGSNDNGNTHILKPN